MLIAISFDRLQRISVRIRCPIYIAALNYYGRRNFFLFVPVKLKKRIMFHWNWRREMCFIEFEEEKSKSRVKQQQKPLYYHFSWLWWYLLCKAVTQKNMIPNTASFTCKITLRINAFTGAVNISCVPRKHHKTMPPFVKMVNKSNILLLCSF